PADGPVRPRRAGARPPGPDRPAARNFRAAGGSEGAGIRGRDRTAGLPTDRASRAFRTATNAARSDRRRLHGTGRTMASRELLMTRHDIHIGRRRTGPTRLRLPRTKRHT